MLVEHDVAAARRLLSDDYVFLQADGNVSNKAQNLAVIGDPGFMCESFQTEDVEVRVYGDTAVVTGRAVMKATYRGQDTGGHFRYMDVWIKRTGSWQLVASQATLLPQRR
jgi:ketosteroid isomerase-like protein